MNRVPLACRKCYTASTGDTPVAPFAHQQTLRRKKPGFFKKPGF